MSLDEELNKLRRKSNNKKKKIHHRNILRGQKSLVATNYHVF